MIIDAATVVPGLRAAGGSRRTTKFAIVLGWWSRARAAGASGPEETCTIVQASRRG
jgi:hypothetical protein